MLTPRSPSHAVKPMAIEAAVEAQRRSMEARSEQQRIAELELQQARYEASLAERRYAACDPDNRLIAAQLEKSWERRDGADAGCCARRPRGRLHRSFDEPFVNRRLRADFANGRADR